MDSHAAVLAGCLLLLAAASGRARAAQADIDLGKLRPGHPRLVCLNSDLERVRSLIESDDTAKQYAAYLRGQATRLLKKPPVEYHVIGPRLLHVSRRALERLMTLGLIARLDGREEVAERAVQELMTICAFKDWHPSHFLDTAEMTHAAAIGYDWLHDRLTPEQRETVRQAIVKKGLLAAKPFYDKQRWWVTCSHNWNQVCNGGISIGALAVADEEPDLARFILGHARTSIVRAMRSYAPDGGWAEGPGYWHYATRYTVYFIAALESALGTDLGLKGLQGFSEAGDFRLHFVGPTGHTFNYADAGSRAGRTPEMFWLARAFDRPLYAWHERTRPGRPDAWHLIWFDPRGKEPKATSVPRSRLFTGVDVAFLRSDWTDPQALFVGFKGGNNRANHSHLDLGTFVLDALGQRWALDLGADHYNMPGYFGGKRWTYYRLRTEGHNTLTIGGKNQSTSARAPIVAFNRTPRRTHAVADLSKAYAAATRWHRGVAMLDRKEVLVQDEVTLKSPTEMVWTLHTKAKIETDGTQATLTRGDAALRAAILAPDGAAFETASAHAPEPQNPNRGVRKLLIRLPEVTKTRIAVLLTPFRGEEPTGTRRLKPLADWRGESP